jgi:hypothetical protein
MYLLTGKYTSRAFGTRSLEGREGRDLRPPAFLG